MGAGWAARSSLSGSNRCDWVKRTMRAGAHDPHGGTSSIRVEGFAVTASIPVRGGIQRPPRPPVNEETVRHELNVLALIKGNERYVFVYDDDSRPELLDTFRDSAADPALSFTWFDAAVLSEKARQQAETSTPPRPVSRSRI